VHQRVNFPGVVARNLLRLKIIEGFAEIVALAQDRDPGKPGLKTIEDEFFIERTVIEFRNAPFIVVIGDVERIFAWPRTTCQPIGMQARPFRHATVCLGGDRISPGSASRIPRPPDVSGVPAASASAVRSILIRARPRWPAVDPMVPTGLSPARIA